MRIYRAQISLRFVSALLFAALFAASAASGQIGDKTNAYQSPVQKQTSFSSGGNGNPESGEAKFAAEPQAEEERSVVVTPAVKRNFSTRYGVDLTEKDRQAVAMDAEDAERFAGFLARKDAGFARLYDIIDCEMDRRILKVGDQCPANMLGRGTSFSFRRKKYQTGWYSDLKTQRGMLQTTGLNVLGFMADLGDVPLESLTLENEVIRTMASFQPAEKFEAVREQSYASARGFQINNFIYRNSLPVRENNTYALRSIAFRGKVLRRAGIFWINALDGDKRDDVIIVFRLIRRHANGSISLLWRELQRTRSPKLIAPKDKK